MGIDEDSNNNDGQISESPTIENRKVNNFGVNISFIKKISKAEEQNDDPTIT